MDIALERERERNVRVPGNSKKDISAGWSGLKGKKICSEGLSNRDVFLEYCVNGGCGKCPYSLERDLFDDCSKVTINSRYGID